MKAFDVIKRPLVTEKSSLLQAQNQFCFAVDPRATKRDIAAAIQALFKVKVAQVATINVRGKQKRVGKNVGRTSNWKKAIVTLKEGERITLFEGA